MAAPEFKTITSKNIWNKNDPPVEIGATCVAEIAANVFVLLVEVEIAVVPEEIEEILVIRITPAQAAQLIPSIGRCEIVGPEEIPTPATGRDVELICTFVFGENAFLVFDVETRTSDDLVVVRTPICPVVG